MSKKFRFWSYLLLALLFVCLFNKKSAFAQKAFMSPYTPDSNTVLLLHFDGDASNASTYSDNGQPHGNVSYVNDPMGNGLGKMLYLDNSSRSDSSYISVPDTAALDLTGSWTMEGWVNLLTYGESNDDWRWRPKLMVKPGTDVRSHSNFYNVLRGDLQAFNTGWWSPSGGNWIDIRSPDNSFKPGNWYHVTFIRDSTHHVMAQLVHDDHGNLINFGAQSYDPILNDPPNTTDEPVYIGINLGQDGGWLDGFIDELRISNVVRSMTMPPIITDVTQLDNQMTSQSAEVKGNIITIGGSSLKDAMLHYNAGDGWQSVSMMGGQESSYSASIPGQSSGTTVQYYVSAETDSGMTATIPSGATNTDNPVYYNYAVVDTSTQILDLTFEEGQGTPIDHSQYQIPVEAHGQPQYKDSNVPGSSKALFLDGDSSYVKIGSPNSAFLKSSEFVVDFWMQAQDSLPSFGTRILIKEGAASWNDFNYQIWSTGGGSIVPASYVPGGTNPIRTGSLTGLDSTIVANKWYRVVDVMKADTNYSRLYDAQNNLIDENGGAIDGDVNLSNGAFYIGAYTDALTDNSEPFGVPDGPLFRGMIDNVKIFNYVPKEYQPDSTNTAIENNAVLPQKITLKQNYPNPFNPTTNIKYSIPKAQKLTLKVYDVLGRQVAKLVDKKQQAGTYSVTFDASHLSSGVYIYELKTDNHTKVHKMLLIK